jgi:hypothetical protein
MKPDGAKGSKTEPSKEELSETETKSNFKIHHMTYDIYSPDKRGLGMTLKRSLFLCLSVSCPAPVPRIS